MNVTDVRVRKDYVLSLTFNTGETGDVDMRPLMWGPVFTHLLTDYDAFCAVRVDPHAGTISWPNGADWDPDELYAKATRAR